MIEQMEQGAYYRRKDGKIVGPADWEGRTTPGTLGRRMGWWVVDGVSYDEKGRAIDLYLDLTKRVWIVDADPVAWDERIAELQSRVEQLEQDARMACETPNAKCDCAGCLFAREVYGGKNHEATCD